MPVLDWDGKTSALNVAENIPRRILQFDENLSCGENSDNLIVQGENLAALKALLPFYRGQVKCIYIDPPYNTGAAFPNYNDNFPHSVWLSMMYQRLLLLREVLSSDGSIFIQIDDTEHAYLKILMDEIFGRDNFVNNITWKRRGGSANPSNRLNNVTDNILWYSKSCDLNFKPVFSKEDENTKKYIRERFKFKDADGRIYMKSPIQSPNLRQNLIYEYKGYRVPTKGWSISKEIMEKWDAEGRLAFPDDKSKTINRKIYLDEYKGQPINNLWADIFVINPMSGERIDFDGQKPEALIQRIFEMTTNEDDLVLDAFLGSGTTAAVAHKMKRRYIGIEQEETVLTHVLPRLKKVIDGEQGGISKAVNWTGGGNFKFCRLGEKLVDDEGIINPALSFGQLAAYVWYSATKTPARADFDSPLLGIHEGKAIYYLHNEKLTRKTFEKLPIYDGAKIIYATARRIGETFLAENKITFHPIKEVQ